MGAESEYKVFTQEEIQHLISVEKRLILILNGVVYDVTDFAQKHPGGEEVLLSNAGVEMGSTFDRIHGKTTRLSVSKYRIGRMNTARSRVTVQSPRTQLSGPFALTDTTVLESEVVTEDIRRILFSSPEPLQLLPGGYIRVVVQVPEGNFAGEGCFSERCFCPILTSETAFSIISRRSADEFFYNHLFSLQPGCSLKYAGPFPPAWIAEKDKALQSEAIDSRNVLLVAGGTGFVPIYSIAEYLLESNTADVTLVLSIGSMHQMVLREELSALRAAYGECKNRGVDGHSCNSECHRIMRFHLLLTRSKECPMTLTDNVHFTRFGAEVVGCLPKATLAVVCGPPAFTSAVVEAVVKGGICHEDRVNIL
ncbi:Cytochrome b5 like Heme Steroid binding domain [Trypanosoma vivax]|nr:putative nitrate reductase [Trypanosoma vivax]KAH8608858.1 Cytochrome b5 like Heme Steroid binding domain [Trypanosoma vivax]